MAVTMKEIRETAKRKMRNSIIAGMPEMVPYYEKMLSIIEELWKNGFCKEFDNDILADAAGYKVNTGDEGFSVTDTLDMRVMTATKASAKAFGAYLFEI